MGKYYSKLGIYLSGTSTHEATLNNAGNTPNSLAQVPEETNSQSGDQVSVSQTLGSATPNNLNLSPSLSPRTQENLSLAGNTPNSLAPLPETTNSQSVDQVFINQFSGLETSSDLDSSPSSSPRAHKDLGLAEAAFAMEDEVQEGLFHVLKFSSEKDNPSKDKGR